MGVDASYLYGYGAVIEDLEWDIEYLNNKYKDKLNEKINPASNWSPTWQGFIESLEEAVNNEDSYLSEVLEDISSLVNVEYTYDEKYLTFNHKHISNMFPDTMLKDLDDVAKIYAKEIGIKNVDVLKWIEFGYFS